MLSTNLSVIDCAVCLEVPLYMYLCIASSPGHTQLFNVENWVWPGDEATHASHESMCTNSYDLRQQNMNSALSILYRGIIIMKSSWQATSLFV